MNADEHECEFQVAGCAAYLERRSPTRRIAAGDLFRAGPEDGAPGHGLDADLDVGCWMLDVGCSMFDVRCSMFPDFGELSRAVQRSTLHVFIPCAFSASPSSGPSSP